MSEGESGYCRYRRKLAVDLRIYPHSDTPDSGASLFGTRLHAWLCCVCTLPPIGDAETCFLAHETIASTVIQYLSSALHVPFNLKFVL